MKTCAIISMKSAFIGNKQFDVSRHRWGISGLSFFDYFWHNTLANISIKGAPAYLGKAFYIGVSGMVTPTIVVSNV